MKNFLLSILLVFLLISCATPHPLHPPHPQEKYTIAVLPMYNATNDVDGPRMVRRILNEKIQIYYKTKPLDEVDRLLRDQLGITLGNQLGTITPQRLGEVLGVDGVIFGYLINFDDITTVVYNVSTVRAGFKLVDTKTGSTIWARGKGLRRVTGAMDIGAIIGAIGTSDYEPIKDAEGIAGINEWLYVRGDLFSLSLLISISALTHGNVPSEAEKLLSSEDVPLSQVLFTVFLGLNPIPLSAKSIGKALNVHLSGESTVVIDNIIKTIGAERHYFSQTSRVPRLFFPAYLVFGERDFNADMQITIFNKTTKEMIRRDLQLYKRGDKLRSNRVLENTSVIVNRDDKKCYLLFKDYMKYIEVDLEEFHFKKTEISNEFVGYDKGKCDENLFSQMLDSLQGKGSCEKHKIKVSYSDGYIKEGYIWKVKKWNGFVKKVEIEDPDTTINIEFKDVSFERPPAKIFEVPKEYEKINQ